MTIDTAMVTEQQIFDELKRVLVETFEIDPAAVVPEAKLYDDLDLDSIDAVDLLVKLRPFVGDRKESATLPADNAFPEGGRLLATHDCPNLCRPRSSDLSLCRLAAP